MLYAEVFKRIKKSQSNFALRKLLLMHFMPKNSPIVKRHSVWVFENAISFTNK
jgi:hypothetical protein